MKTINHILSALLIAVSCNVNTDNNHSLDYDTLEIKFSATSNDISFDEGDEIGILSYCTREGVENTAMKADISSTEISRQIPVSEGNHVLLKNVADEDAIIAYDKDHNFRFYGIYPFPEKDFNVTAIPMGVPYIQFFSEGLKSRMTLVASSSSTNVVPTQKLEFKNFFSVINLRIAKDIIEEDVPAVLRRIVFKPKDPLALEDPLAVDGFCNADLMTFAADLSSGKKELTVDFGDTGYALEDDFTVVPMLVNPFYVPEGGFELIAEDIHGSTNTVEVLAEPEDNGRQILSGEVVDIVVDRVNDGVIPVEWPVIFPLGFPEGSSVGYFNKSVQTRWDSTSDRRGEGYWFSNFQEQAYAEWHWGEESSTFDPLPFLETINSGGKHSTPGIKGAWTGDYLEFTIPVKKFPENSTVTMSLPICSKNSPVFWEVRYLDGDEWKSTAVENLPAYEGSDITRTATWALQFGGAPGGSAVKSATMHFENRIQSGYLKIRLQCVDGSVVMSAANTVKILTEPAKNSTGTACSGNFYFSENLNSSTTDFKSYTEVRFELQ